jgi:hypothetical protein
VPDRGNAFSDDNFQSCVVVCLGAGGGREARPDRRHDFPEVHPKQLRVLRQKRTSDWDRRRATVQDTLY